MITRIQSDIDYKNKGVKNTMTRIYIDYKNKEVKNTMTRIYIAARNKVNDFLTDKRGVSHLLEVVGILALAALILVIVFPGARTKIGDIWNTLVGHVDGFIREQQPIGQPIGQ